MGAEMKYSDMALFTLTARIFEVNGKNAISGNKSFSNNDFFKLTKYSACSHFQHVCEKKLKENINEFYLFKDAVAQILDGEYDNIDNNVINTYLIKELIKLYNTADGIVCYFDSDFPQINPKVEKDSEKPFLLFYKGDISLLKDLNRNVAVIGVLNPGTAILAREKRAVHLLVDKGMNIVSGLAKGCDTAAHMACLEAAGKTIAILPSTLAQILPAENRQLARDIVENGGLLVTEYFLPAKDQSSAIKRYIDRDRLQAMFAKAIVLSASYNDKTLGDCGSKYAMGKAGDYSLYRTIIYNKNTDHDNAEFGLNKEYYDNEKADVLTPSVLERVINYNINYGYPLESGIL